MLVQSLRTSLPTFPIDFSGDLSPVRTSNNVEATLSKQQATLLPVASTMLPFWATMSKQRSTLSKGRNFNAKLVRYCCRFWQQSRTSLRHCCWCGRGFRLTRDLFVRFIQQLVSGTKKFDCGLAQLLTRRPSLALSARARQVQTLYYDAPMPEDGTALQCLAVKVK